MWRSKKFIVGVLLATVLVVGSIGGIVLAQENGDDNQPQAQYEALLDKVCAIYEQKTGVAIEQEVLKDAFAQAQGEMRAAALENRLAKLVDEGVIDETQKQELLDWWKSRPDTPVNFGFGGRGGFRGMGGFHGFGGLGGFPGWFEPPPTAE